VKITGRIDPYISLVLPSMSLDIFIVSVLPNALMRLCITGADLLRERISIIRALMSKSSIVGCLGRSLGQAPISAKSDTDWIHFVTPRATAGTLLINSQLYHKSRMLPLDNNFIFRRSVITFFRIGANSDTLWWAASSVPITRSLNQELSE